MPKGQNAPCWTSATGLNQHGRDMSEQSSDYIHGSSEEERARLSLLNDILNLACLQKLNPQPGERVIDFGSGLGQFSRQIARRVGPDGSVTGIERDAKLIAEAKNFAKQAGEAGLVDFRQGDAAESAPPQDRGKFDLAYARFLLEHVPDAAAVIKRMVHSVRPGGRVVVIDDDHDNFRPWPEPPGFDALWRAYVQSFERLGSDPFVGRKLVGLLQQAGLSNLRNDYVFFGGCAGDDRFLATIDNLIGAFKGAKTAMLASDDLDEAGFANAVAALEDWKTQPSSALWYAASYAEGRVPS